MTQGRKGKSRFVLKYLNVKTLHGFCLSTKIKVAFIRAEALIPRRSASGLLIDANS